MDIMISFAIYCLHVTEIRLCVQALCAEIRLFCLSSQHTVRLHSQPPWQLDKGLRDCLCDYVTMIAYGKCAQWHQPLPGPVLQNTLHDSLASLLLPWNSFIPHIIAVLYNRKGLDSWVTAWRKDNKKRPFVYVEIAICCVKLLKF